MKYVHDIAFAQLETGERNVIADFIDTSVTFHPRDPSRGTHQSLGGLSEHVFGDLSLTSLGLLNDFSSYVLSWRFVCKIGFHLQY